MNLDDSHHTCVLITDSSTILLRLVAFEWTVQIFIIIAQTSAYLQYKPGSFIWVLKGKAMQMHIYAFTRSTFITVVLFS